jgi:PmbA protein
MQYDEIKDFIGKELKKTGVKDYEIFYIESDDLTIELKDKKVDSLLKAVDKSLSLRVLNGDRIGFSYCTKFNEDGIGKMVENAFHTSQNTKADECNRFADRDYDTPPKIKDYDNDIKDIPFSKKIDALSALEDAAYGYDNRVKSARKIEYVQSLKDVRVFNSLGIDCSHKKTVFSFSAMVAASQGDETEISWDTDFSNFYDKLDPVAVGNTAAKKACEALNATVIKSEKLPVILDRLIASELLSVLAPSFYADYIIKNKSALKGKIGAKILSDNLTIVDDPLFDGGIATFPFDAEGSLSAKTKVVENGVLMQYLSDTYTSQKMGIENTSNSVKGSLFAPPMVGSTNFYILPGKSSKEELVREMKRGLIITDAMGLHTANPISGDFSIGISGFFVENGAAAFPVRGLVFSGNLFDMLNNVAGIADDLKFYFKCASPSLLIKSADIAGKQ